MHFFCIIWLLHSFHAASFLVLLYVALVSCCTFFILHSFQVSLFRCCTLFVFHFFHVTLFSCWTLFMLHFFHVAPCSNCTVLCVALLSRFTFSLVVSCCTLLMMHFLGIQNSNFINKRLHHRYFPVKFEHLFWRTPANDCFKKFSLKLSQCQSLTILLYFRDWIDSSYSDQKQSSRSVLWKMCS